MFSVNELATAVKYRLPMRVVNFKAHANLFAPLPGPSAPVNVTKSDALERRPPQEP